MPVPSIKVRTYLSSLSSGAPNSPDPEVWRTLEGHGAITGTPSQPEMTPVGRHVLRELEARASRTDTLSLDVVAEELTRVLQDIDHVAKTAEYFLAELGPVTPPEAIALLRPVVVSLANRRETPEELTREFSDVWGTVEVMGGEASDRLLAAELLLASSASIEKVFAPMMLTAERIRAKLGAGQPSVSIAAILHLGPGAEARVPFDAFLELREEGGRDEAAALLAAFLPDPSEAARRRKVLATALGGPSQDATLAASYLIASGANETQAIPRVRAISQGLVDAFASPLTPAAVLASRTTLDPGELLNWLEKATEIVRARRLAPTVPELSALGLAIVHGLPDSEFTDASGSRPVGATRVSLPALVALHAWIYRPLVSSPEESPAAAG
ncbi:MAG: hypothetical protein L3K09_01555 [Thermoplasmata archaeon]|nr:hypothetical protein [Thermoplasmata archaeon]